MLLYCSITIFKSSNLNINAFVLHVQAVKRTDGPFRLFAFLKEVKEFLYHWVKPATCNGFGSTVIDSHIWEMVQLRVSSFVNISN